MEELIQTQHPSGYFFELVNISLLADRGSAMEEI